MRYAPIAASLLLLAACHAKVEIGEDAREHGDNVHVAMDRVEDKKRVSLDVPGFSAKVTLPDLDIGGHMDMDGIKLAPDTDVTSLDVQGRDGGASRGQVSMAFTNPGKPDALIAYYRKAATDAGFADMSTTGSGLAALKRGKRFALSVTPDGAGSRGTIMMTGSD